MLASAECSPCSKPKKAPIFQMGDVVTVRDGSVFRISLMAERHGERAYSAVPVTHHDMRFHDLRWYSGHELKKFTGRK